MWWVPENESDVNLGRESLQECNMLHPESDDSQDEEQEELFTAEYFKEQEKTKTREKSSSNNKWFKP